MGRVHRRIHLRDHKSYRDSLEKFIAQLPSDGAFSVHDWLKTLSAGQLRRLEEDARTSYHHETTVTLAENAGNDLVNIALTAYIAESHFELDQAEAAESLDGLLIGLAVAACVERLRRNGWVTVTRSLSILIRDPRPYRVTQKGWEEGVWSHEPLTLWILGAHIGLH